MADTEHGAPTKADASKGHEARDVNIRSVTMVGVGLAVVTAAVMFLMWLLQQEYMGPPAASIRRIPPSAVQRDSSAEPPLQVAPQKDLRKFRAEEEAVLNSYGWANKSKGAVRLTIDRAMDLVAERGLPSRVAVEEQGLRKEDRE